jgi:hypothetical protein
MSEPSSPSNLSPAPTLIRDHSLKRVNDSEGSSQAEFPAAQDRGSKQILCYTATAVKEGISGCGSGGSWRSDPAARSAQVSASKTEEEELLDRLVQCEGVLGLGQQDENGAAVARVRRDFCYRII